MSDSWIVVANSSKCRVLKRDRGHRLAEVEDLDNPEGRLHEGDLVTDSAGHLSENQKPQSAFVPHQSAKERVVENFARKVAQRLEAGRRRHAFADLTILAPPAFLGLLRKQLSEPTLRAVRDELTCDIVEADEATIRRHLGGAARAR